MKAAAGMLCTYSLSVPKSKWIYCWIGESQCCLCTCLLWNNGGNGQTHTQTSRRDNVSRYLWKLQAEKINFKSTDLQTRQRNCYWLAFANLSLLQRLLLPILAGDRSCFGLLEVWSLELLVQVCLDYHSGRNHSHRSDKVVFRLLGESYRKSTGTGWLLALDCSATIANARFSSLQRRPGYIANGKSCQPLDGDSGLDRISRGLRCSTKNNAISG